MTAIFIFSLTHVGPLGHHVLTPAADSSEPGPLVTGIGGPIVTGIGGPLHRNTHQCLQTERVELSRAKRAPDAPQIHSTVTKARCTQIANYYALMTFRDIRQRR